MNSIDVLVAFSTGGAMIVFVVSTLIICIKYSKPKNLR